MHVMFRADECKTVAYVEFMRGNRAAHRNSRPSAEYISSDAYNINTAKSVVMR